jgi:hypothetical protein
MMNRRIGLGLLLAVACTVFGPRAAGAQSLTEDQVIDQTLRIDSVTGADDLVAEATRLAQAFVDDPADYSGVGINLTRSTPLFMHYRGATVSTMAALIPLLPGPVTSSQTLAGRLAARLRTDVTTYLLNSAYWDWEYATGTAAPYIQAANPNIQISISHRYRSGPHWEKMHALWAYAYYTGDWALLQANWSFIQARYDDGEKSTGAVQRAQMIPAVFRNAANDFANGTIGYVRIAQHLGQTSAVTAARPSARAALIDAAARVNMSWANAGVTTGWDNTPATMMGEWSPGYNLSPEIGRYINDRVRATAQTRLDEAANSGELRGHWWTGYVNNVDRGRPPFPDEDYWGMPNLSHQLFLGRAWMLMENSATLRPVKPWHVTMGSTPEYRDMLYIRSLYALITRHASVSWVAAN